MKKRNLERPYTTLRIDQEVRDILGDIRNKDEDFNSALKRILRRGPFL